MAEETEEVTRYNQLLLLLDKTLSHSRKAFDIEKAIKECYGDDAKMFEVDSSSEEEENFLVSAMNAMMDAVNDKAKKGTLEYMKEQGTEKLLDKIEAIIDKLDKSDEQMKQADVEDRRTAQAALEASKLPKGVLPGDVMRYQAYLSMEQHRLAMLQKLEEEEAAMEKIVERKRELEGIVEEGNENLKRVKQTLQNSAEQVKENGIVA